MIELTIMGSKVRVVFVVDKIAVLTPVRTGGTTIFTIEGAKWVVTESLNTVLAKIESVKGDWLK